MATVITELAALLSNFGFGPVLIQRRRITRLQMDTTFWAALALGLGLTSTVFLLSFIAGSLYDDPMVGPILKVMCISFVLDELTVVPRSLMARLMMFREDVLVQSTMLLFRAGTAIVLATHGFGVWSLVAGALAGTAFQAITYSFVTGFRPRLRFSRSFIASTWKTNSGYFGNGILFYINSNLDTFLVGRLLGATSLGYYQNSRSLTDEIRERMVQPIQRVLFPAFSAIQDDPARFRAGIMSGGRLLALVFMPMGFGIYSVARELVPLLYGDQWLPMIPVLEILSIGTGLVAVTSIGNPIFMATDRIRLSFVLYLGATLVAVAAISIGSQFGLMGVAYAKLAVLIVWLIFFWRALRLVNLGWSQMFQMVGGPLLASLAMVGTVEAFRDSAYELFSGRPGRLASLILLGASAYAVGALVFCRPHAREVIALVKKLRTSAT